MNILFVHDHVMRKFNEDYYSTGGLSGNVLNRYLYNENDRIYVYTRKKNIDSLPEKLVKANNDKVICLPTEIYNNPLDYYTKKKKIKSECIDRLKNIDFCIIRLQSTLGAVAYEEVRKRKIPYMVEMVACPWDSLWNYGNIKAKIFAPILYLKTKKQIKNADYVVYVSEKFLQKRYPTKGKWISCSNVNIENVDEIVLKNRLEKINEDNKKTYKIGLIGSLNVNFKGHETAIKAISLLKNKYNIELHFLGAGDKERWISLIKKYNVVENVFFDGTLPSGEPVYNWMDDLDVFLIPSLQEGLPRALIEAMSRGCPAIGVRTGGIPELLDSEFVCRRKDYKSIANKIEALLINKAKMEEQSRKNFNYAKKYNKNILNDRRENFIKKKI